MSRPKSWAKDGYWKCPSCIRHFMSGNAANWYEGLCNMCNTQIHEKADRVK